MILFCRIFVYGDYFSPGFMGRIEPTVFLIEPLSDDQITQMLLKHGIYGARPFLAWIKDSNRPELFATVQSIAMLADVGTLESIHSQDDLTRLYVEKHLHAEANYARSSWRDCRRLLVAFSKKEDATFQEESVFGVIDSFSQISGMPAQRVLEQTLSSGILLRRSDGHFEFIHSRFKDYFDYACSRYGNIKHS